MLNKSKRCEVALNFLGRVVDGIRLTIMETGERG